MELDLDHVDCVNKRNYYGSVVAAIQCWMKLKRGMWHSSIHY